MTHENVSTPEGISRRDVLKLGAGLGLALPFLPSLVAGGSVANAATKKKTTKAKAGGTLRITAQKPSGPLNPTKMADLGTYSVVTESFEYLCGQGDGTTLAPSLATSWTPNADGSEWTFKLRKGVKWSDGSAFTSADVAASIARLQGGNLKANVVGASTPDPLTVVVKLKAPDAQFPYFLSLWNAQSVIAPASFTADDTLDKKPACTGPWKLEKFDATQGATFVRNPLWWGGKTILDKIQFIFSDDLATQIAGMQGGQADAIVQYSVIGGEALQNDPNFKTVVVRGAAHRQIWMNVRDDSSPFKDKRVRQAVALGIDRQALIQTLFKGAADIGNDHPIAPVYSFFDKTQPQRTRDVAKAKALLKEAGKENLKMKFYAPKLQEIPELAQLVQTQLKDIGMDLELVVESTDTFYDQWCKVYDSKVEPAGCDGGQNFGIVDYGNRGWPDVYLLKAYSTGEWNSAHYNSPDFKAAVAEYQKSFDNTARSAAIKKVQAIANEDVPYVIPYFYQTQFAHSKKVSGIRASGLGHYDVSKASFV